MPNRIRSYRDDDRNPGSQCSRYSAVIRLMAERHHHIRPHLFYKSPQPLLTDSQLGDSALALFLRIQAHMDSCNTLINTKFIFRIPFRSDIDLVTLSRKLVGQIGNNPLSPALFQAVYMKDYFTHICSHPCTGCSYINIPGRSCPSFMNRINTSLIWVHKFNLVYHIRREVTRDCFQTNACFASFLCV